jgi:TRAP-type uncharacterized transport system fused permease subunit
MFAIPFVFAFYPELLLIDQALIDPSSPSGAPLPGYENGIGAMSFAWLIARLILALYLVASALARFDASALSISWVFLRLALAVLIMLRPETIHVTAVVATVVMLVWHHVRGRNIPMSRDEELETIA